MEHDPEKWRPVFRKIMLKQRDLNLFAKTGIDLPLGMIT